MAFNDSPEPLDESAPSRNFVAPPAASDVAAAAIYPMLLEGLRVLDEQQGGGLVRRFLKRPEEQWARLQEKAWLLPRLLDYRQIPADLLRFLRAHVGFGERSGLPDRIADRLDATGVRKLIKLAVPYWTRRGRLDALTDSIRTLATGIRPAVDDWFFVRFLLDEVLLGVEALPGADPWLLYESVLDVPTGGGADGEVQVSIRVPDLGTLDRTLVEDLIRLARPAGERYEIAYVDFLDTFIDGRLGHWLTAAPPAAVWKPADRTVDPPVLPGFELTAPGREAIDVPKAAAWTGYSIRFIVRFTAAATLIVRFYVQDADNYYWLKLKTPDTIEFGKVVGGVSALIASNNAADLAVPAARGVVVQVEDNGGANQVRVLLDTEEALLDASDATFGAGAVHFEAGAGTFSVHRVEVYEDPLAIVVLGG